MARRAGKRAMAAAVKLWQKRLGLTDWRLTIVYGPDPEDGSEASCVAKPEYKTATLCFDLTQINAEEVDEFAVHELVHCLIWPISNAAETMAKGDKAKSEWIRTLDEELTTKLERILLALVKGAA